MARPVVIKMERDLSEDIVRTNMHTLKISRKEFDKLLNLVRRKRKEKK
jgi:hypothetical protein